MRLCNIWVLYLGVSDVVSSFVNIRTINNQNTLIILFLLLFLLQCFSGQDYTVSEFLYLGVSDVVSAFVNIRTINNRNTLKYLNYCLQAEDGMTALHVAAQSGHCNVVEYLVEQACVPLNSQDDGGWTAMVWAAEHRHLDCVRYLLARGTDPNIRDNVSAEIYWSPNNCVNTGHRFRYQPELTD